ncbi:MAG: hypothetical protein KTR26_00880 [Flammeovirgaceae bacterium]|nr:hypothetical protein [Flammeovirgaceae bacterium]
MRIFLFPNFTKTLKGKDLEIVKLVSLILSRLSTVFAAWDGFYKEYQEILQSGNVKWKEIRH